MKSPRTIAISATFTAEPITQAVQYWLGKLNLEGRLSFAPYHQVFQQLLDPSSVIGSNRDGLNVLLLRPEDWTAGAYDEKALERTAGDLVRALSDAAERGGAPILVVSCHASPIFLGNPGSAGAIARAEAALAAAAAKLSGVHFVSSGELSGLYPVEDYHDALAEKTGKIPYKDVYFAALGTLVARKFRALVKPPAKVLLLDCDNTLWTGVVGEEGPMGIVIDEHRRAFQEFIVRQHKAGMLIGLCSKNAEADVFEVFEKRKDMPLTREHIACWRINWDPKSENIKSIAKELSLGMDSFIFMDDDDVQCAEVEANCPGVVVVQVPRQAAELPKLLGHVWAFDRLRITEEDLQRNAMHKQEREREMVRKSALSMDEFLASLELRVDIAPMTPERLPRVAQLTQKTNQFNFTTIRRTESDIAALLASGHGCLTVEVRDRFGEYGLVGVVIYRSEGKALLLDSFLLSCRVLGRRVEHSIMAELGAIARRERLSTVRIPFLPTPKNTPAAEFLDSVFAEHKSADGPGLRFEVPAEVASALCAVKSV